MLIDFQQYPGWKQVSITWFNYFDRVEFHPLFPTLDFDFPLSLPRSLTSACLLIFMFLRVQNKSAEPHLITLAGLDFTPYISPLDYVLFLIFLSLPWKRWPDGFHLSPWLETSQHKLLIQLLGGVEISPLIFRP